MAAFAVPLLGLIKQVGLAQWKTHICQERQSFVQDDAISCCVLLFTTGPSWKVTIPEQEAWELKFIGS